MPLYEYQCKQCRQRMEKIQSFSAAPEKICPKCGGELERLISAPAIQFKGAGWYVNDYARSGGKAKSEESGDGKGESKSDSKSGTVTDVKAEAGKSSAPSSDSPSPATTSTPPASGSSPSSSKSE